MRRRLAILAAATLPLAMVACGDDDDVDDDVDVEDDVDLDPGAGTGLPGEDTIVE